MIGRQDQNGPQGDGVNEDVAFTLNATDKHAVVYAIDRETFNCGQNFARNLGISEDGIASTLNAQGPSAVASFYPQMKAESQCYREDGKANTLINGTNPGFQNGIVERKEEITMGSGENITGAILASCGKKQFLGNQEAFSGDYHVIEPNYIVRRLTPTECALLQGFDKDWCSYLGTENPTDEDISFWADVFETHRKIIGTSLKPKSEKQIIKWLKNPYSESAEYKIWGNGVALPCVNFVMAGIVKFCV